MEGLGAIEATGNYRVHSSICCCLSLTTEEEAPVEVIINTSALALNNEGSKAQGESGGTGT